MSTRKFFDDVQMGMESGGRQHDKQGRPLVGRYRDGTTPKESEKAYGAGQMQIGTARATAQKHGISWDQNRFMNDKEYNLTLADKHMEDLIKKYGDRRIARGAYHSGEGNVDRAIAKYGREGFAQGLGPEGRKYVGMSTYNATSGGKGVSDPNQFLQGLESVLGPQGEASQNISSNASHIFGSDAEFERRGQAVETELGNQLTQLGVLDTATQALQAVQVKAAEQQVSETRAVNDEIISGTQALKDKVAPIIQARGEIADQLDKINSMNPLERGLRGIFDLNYDQKYLTAKLDRFDQTMKARADDYKYLQSLHSNAMDAIDRRYSLDTALPGLTAKQAEEDLALVGMRIQQTSASLGNLRDMVNGQSQLIAAKAGAREDMLSRLDMPTLQKLSAAAMTAGGVVTHGGVELSYNELYERQQAKEQYDLNREAVKMSIAQNRMDMADKYATNLARSLTRSQLEGAISNGGMHDGIQLPQDVLTQLYGSAVARDKQLAENAANNLPASNALRLATDSLSMTTGLYRRGKEIYGSADFTAAGSIMSQGASDIRALSEAVKTGQPPEVIAALTARVNSSREAMTKYTDDVILRKVGGDKKAASYLKSFVYGTPLAQGAAVEGIAYFAVKGSLPEGMQSSRESQAVFKKAQALVAQYRDEKGSNGKPLTEAEITRRVTADLTRSAASTVGQVRYGELFSDVPALARRANHPLGRMSNADWRKATSEARYDSLVVASRELGINFDQAQKMYDTGRPIDSTPESKALFDKFKGMAGTINAAEYQSLASNLDELPQVTPGRRNSSVLMDYVSDGRFAKQVTDYTAARGGSNLGDYLVNPLAAGSTQSMFAQFSDGFMNARASEYAGRRQLAKQQPAGTLMNPAGRAMVYLRAMPGVSSDGAKRLQPYIQKITQNLARDESNFKHLRSGNLTVNSMMRDQDAQILEGLKTLKFDDPGLETIRKNAVSGWSQTQVQAKGLIESIVETGAEFFDLDGR